MASYRVTFLQDGRRGVVLSTQERGGTDMTQPTQRLYPFLYVDDVPGYLKFLDKAFGFVERSYHVDPDDSEHVHAEMALGDAVVMIGRATPKFDTASPRPVVASVYAYV